MKTIQRLTIIGKASTDNEQKTYELTPDTSLWQGDVGFLVLNAKDTRTRMELTDEAIALVEDLQPEENETGKYIVLFRAAQTICLTYSPERGWYGLQGSPNANQVIELTQDTFDGVDVIVGINLTENSYPVKHQIDELNQFQHTRAEDHVRVPTMEEQVVATRYSSEQMNDEEIEEFPWTPQLGMFVVVDGHDEVFIIDDYQGHAGMFVLRSTDVGYERVSIPASKVKPYQLYAKRHRR